MMTQVLDCVQISEWKIIDTYTIEINLVSIFVDDTSNDMRLVHSERLDFGLRTRLTE